jgi:hypothetical protein
MHGKFCLSDASQTHRQTGDSLRNNNTHTLMLAKTIKEGTWMQKLVYPETQKRALESRCSWVLIAEFKGILYLNSQSGRHK